MTTEDNTIARGKELVALSLFAVKFGQHEAKKLAAEKGLTFDCDLALRHVEVLLGKEEAAAQRYLWDETRMAALDRRLDAQRDRLAAQLRLKHRISSFLLTVKRSAEDMLGGINPAGWQANYALRGTTKGAAAGGNTGDARVHVEPRLDHDGKALYIDLKLTTKSARLPEKQAQILLFIEGEQVTDFVFARNDDTSIDLKVVLNEARAAELAAQPITLRYDETLTEIVVILGDDFTDSSHTSDASGLSTPAAKG